MFKSGHSLLLLVFLWCVSFGHSQLTWPLGLAPSNVEQCGFDHFHQLKMANDSLYRKRTLDFNTAVKGLTLPQKVAQTPYKIPVVVHVMSDGTTLTSITDDEIRNAIKALNEHFRNVPGTIGGGNGIDMEIEFALAVRDPYDNCSNGIVRYDLSWNSTYTASGVMFSTSGLDDVTMKSYSVWDQLNYYNIWLVSEIDNNNGGSGTQGFASFASAHGYPGDGAIVLASKFKNYTSNVIVHELGHALNLYHTFEGDASGTTCPPNAACNSDGDLVCDTPPHIRSSSDCVVGANACDGGSSTELFIHNYMDYSSDACRTEFTSDQKTRAIAALTTSRASFLASNGNVSLVPPSIPEVDFTSTSAGGCPGSIIQFFDRSSCTPNNDMDTTSWSGVTFNWTFTNNAGTTYNSSLQNPIITFLTPGTYDVTLSVTNEHGSTDLTEQGFIVITSAPGAATCNSTSSYTGTLTYGIFRVSLGALNHTSGSTLEDNTNGLTVNGYGDFSCSEITVLNTNSTYQLGVKGTSNASLIENFKVYIDYNNDGDFLDAGEEIAAWNNVTGSTALMTANFTTPASPSLNTLLRMRVIGARSTETITPCLLGTRGQCHDFGVFISDKIATVSIAANPSTNITYGTGVTVTATPVNGGASPTYEWYRNGILQIGQTSAVYTNNLLVDGDQIYCKMTSSLNGVIGAPVSSNILTFIVTGPPITNFHAQDTVACVGSPIIFTDASLLSPTAWNWSFPGGTPSTSTLQNPVVSYSVPGTYSVSLTTSNGLGTGGNVIRTGYITVFNEPGAQCTSFTRTNTPILSNGIGIKKVKLGTINYETSNIDNVYQSFVCSEQTELKIDTSYTLTLGVSTVYSQWVRVYVDYNNNNSFLDAGELVYSTNSAVGTITTSITTPATAVLNTLLRMRVITDFGGASTAGPCKTPLAWGQVEDYGVIMKYNCNLPATPGTIAGTTSVCSGATGNVYSISAVPGATSYIWSVPSGATITSGQGTTSVTVNFGSVSGNIGVASSKSCGNSSESLLAVTVGSAPSIPGAISGTATVCSGATGNVYSISAVPGASSYTWSVPSGSTVTSGQGTNSATVTFGSTSGNVSVSATNSCGTSAASTSSITINSAPATPGAVNGSTTVCSGSTGNVYSISAVSGASSYAWSVPAGSAITSGQGTNSATVTFGSTSGNVSVTAANSCGTSAASTSSITINSVPATPGSVNGSTTVCSVSSGNVYSISTVPGASSYTWSVPAGSTVTSGQGTNSATVTFGSTAGNVSVTATNSCGTSAASASAITLNSAPATPGAVNGSTTVCSGATGNVYSISAVPGASSYTWSVPSGSTVTSGQGTNSATVTFGSTSGNVSVSATNSCGTSAASNSSITINSAPSTPGAVNGSTTVCSGSTGNVYSISAVSGASSYTWSVPAGSTVTSGQGTNSATVTFGSTSGNVSVSAANSCGTSAASTSSITITTVPAMPGAINGSTTVCSGSPGNVYSIEAVPEATTYIWSIPPGASISSGQGTISATYNAPVNNSGSSISGPISVSASNGCGTSAASTVLIAVNSNVDIPLVAVSDSCGYSILETSGANLLWSTGETASSIIVLNAGTYTVTQSLNGCSSSPASGLASPLVLPQTPVITVADGCGSSILSASGNGLVWSTGETTSSIIVTVAGTYTVTATSGVCTSIPGSGIAAPIVIPEPPIITVSNNCGNSVLSTTGTGLNWSTGATTPSITVTNSGTYTVTQTSSGCTSSAASGFADPLLIPTVTLSPLSDVCINTPAFELSGGSPLGGVYSGTGVSNNTFDPSVAGLGDFTISYTYTDGNGCSASDQQVISVGCANTDELASSLVQVYPNPGNGTVYVISPQIVLDRIDVYDAHGKRVFNTCEQIENDGFVLYFNSLADGVYTIEFSGEEYFHRVRYILND